VSVGAAVKALDTLSAAADTLGSHYKEPIKSIKLQLRHKALYRAIGSAKLKAPLGQKHAHVTALGCKRKRSNLDDGLWFSGAWAGGGSHRSFERLSEESWSSTCPGCGPTDTWHATRKAYWHDKSVVVVVVLAVMIIVVVIVVVVVVVVVVVM